MAAAGGAGGAGSPAAGDASAAIVRLSKEVGLIAKKPVPGVKFVPGGETNPLSWVMLVDAPDEYTVNGVKRRCPYAGRVFKVNITYPANYPFSTPDLKFEPEQLYHPNTNHKTGEVCFLTVSKAFGPTKNSTDLARLVIGFLESPHLDSPLDDECAHEMATEIDKYEAKATKMAASAPKKA